MERFPFNQNFRKFGTSGKWYRNFSEKFPEIPETGEFSKCKISTENSGRKVEWKENFREKFSKNLGICRKVVLCFGIFERCCSTRYWKLPKIQTGRFGWMERAQGTFTDYKKFPENLVEKWMEQRVSMSLQWRISRSNESSEKVVLFSRTECLKRNSCSILLKPIAGVSGFRGRL